MNKTEAKFASELDQRKMAGEIVEWYFEAVTLKLADACRLTVDFVVLHNDGSLEFVDVKGGGPVSDDSLVKLKCAAEKFFMFQVTMLKQLPKKAGGGWERREF